MISDINMTKSRPRHCRAWTRFCASIGAILLAVGGGAAIVAAPWLTGLDPKSHVYGAIVWLLAIWTAGHALTA